MIYSTVVQADSLTEREAHPLAIDFSMYRSQMSRGSVIHYMSAGYGVLMRFHLIPVGFKQFIYIAISSEVILTSISILAFYKLDSTFECYSKKIDNAS